MRAPGDVVWSWEMALSVVVGAELGAGTGWGLHPLQTGAATCKVSG